MSMVKNHPPRPPPRLKGASLPAGRPAVTRVYPQKDSSLIATAQNLGYEEKFSISEKTFVHPRHGPGVRLTGREIVQMVAPSTTIATGGVLMNWDVAPQNLLGTRAAALSNLYEKYKFRKMQFEWDPEVGSNETGKVILAYDPDCLDASPPASLAGLKQLSSFSSSKLSTVWKPCAIQIVDKEDTLYFTNEAPNSDARFVYQGQFYLANGGVTTFTNGGQPLPLGSVSLSFELEFFKPGVEQNATSNDTQVSVANTATPGAARAAGFGDALNMFNIQNLVNATVPVLKNAGSMQKLVNAVGQTFYRVPAGQYRVQLSSTDATNYTSTAAATSIAPPIVTAVLPPNAPAGASPPALGPFLNSLAYVRPADSASANPIMFGNALTDQVVNAPSGADLYATLGAIVNAAFPATTAQSTYSWEISKLIGNQAISL